MTVLQQKDRKTGIRSGFLMLAFTALLGLGACGSDPDGPDSAITDDAGFTPVARNKPVVIKKAGKKASKHHMVSSANPHASNVGRDILRKGGTAIDAAIAMQIMLTLVEPQSSGIGGGGFLLHFNGKTGEISAYEGREEALGATTEYMFMNTDGTSMVRDRYRVGGISVATPGILRVLETVHKKYGRLPWKDLFTPTITLAQNGFKVSKRLYASIKRDRYLIQYPTARKYFLDETNQPKAVGSLLKNPELANTLTAIANHGANALYQGAIASDIAKATQADKMRPGLLAVRDLAAYKTKKRPQLCGPYRVWLVCGFGPPTAGGVTTLMVLSMLERFKLHKIKPGSAKAVHLISEAFRLANADRLRYVGDPDFVSVPLSGMLNPKYLAERSDRIRIDRAMKHVSPGKFSMPNKRAANYVASEDEEQPSTTHMAIVDKQGNTVSMTASVGGAFGSRIMVRGFMLNNHATDFSSRPRSRSGRPKVNRPGAGKRPRSAQSPTLVFDGSGKLLLAVGSPGGTRIIGYVVKTLIGVLDWKLNIQAAIELPNHAIRRGKIELERDTAITNIEAGLKALGHKTRIKKLTSGLHAIAIGKDGTLYGGADPRREGLVLGD